MRFHAFALGLVFLLSCGGLAQPAASGPATKDDILRMFEVMHTREQIQQFMEQTMHQTLTMNRESLRKRRPEITDEVLDRMEKDATEVMKGLPVNDMMDDMVPVYQKHLTRADVRALINFYSTPIGQKLLRELPTLTTDAMKAVYPRIQEHLEQALQRIDRQREQEKNAAPPPPVDKN